MKTEKKKTLRGSALFTVVAVMAILILFLTGTLALASASNSRAHRSYSISQASYTARSAIRSLKAAMEDPNDGAGIAAAVYALGTDQVPGGKLYPEIRMGGQGMGNVGYWDDEGNWQSDRISLETVPGKIDWVYSDTKDEWLPYNVVRVTSTCRLGREEETVVAYISKYVNEEPGKEEEDSPIMDSEVKGLQEAGGNTFMNGGDIYGGLGVALADDPNDGLGEYELNNAFKTHTTLNFINANVYMLTSSFSVNVENSSANPVSGTVIMGNASIKNDVFVTLTKSYEMKKNFRQRDIPYLYVDKLIYERQGTNSPYVASEDDSLFQPFNMYVGTMYYPKQFKAKADLYLMDRAVVNAEGKRELYEAPDAGLAVTEEWWPNHIVYSWPEEYEKNSNHAVPIGENYFGCDMYGNIATEDVGSRQLYKWASSTFSRKDTYDSYGGNIYCNGNFHMGGAIINGNLRVRGDFYLEKVTNAYKPQILGDLIVEGEIINNSSELSVTQIVSGLVYNNSKAAAGSSAEVTVKTGYEKKENALYPGCKELETKEISNRKLSAENGEVEITSDGKYLVTIPLSDPDNKIFDFEPYVEVIPDEDGNPNESSDIVKITSSPTTRYEVDKDGKIVFKDEDGQKVPVKTDKEHLYFDEDGPCPESEAKGDYYIKSSEPDKIVGIKEACIIENTDQIVPYDDFKAIFRSTAYPENMTRENIYGEYKNGKFETHPETKLVTTLEEARSALSCNADGEFDGSVYYYEEEKAQPVKATYSTSPSDDIVITRPTEGFDWYVLDDLAISGKNIIIKDAPGTTSDPATHKQYGGGIVRFFIKGNLNLTNTVEIRPEHMPETIDYRDDFGIEYYGWAERQESGTILPKSRITNANGCLIVGSIKAPYMYLDTSKGEGPESFTYMPESGVPVTGYNPIIVGNALINKIAFFDVAGNPTEGNMNGFNLAYTKSGTGKSSSSGGGGAGGGGGGSTAKTVFGDFMFTYVVG